MWSAGSQGIPCLLTNLVSSHQIQKRPVMTRSHSGSSGLNKQGKGSLGVLMEGMRVVLNRTGWSIQARQKTVSIRQSSQPKSSSIKFK